MARPHKKSLDYFPLDCIPDDDVHYIEVKYGLTGFAIIIKLWSKIYSSNGYYCLWDDKIKFLFCNRYKIDMKEFDNILKECFSEKIFDKDLFDRHGILTSKEVHIRYLKIIKEARRKEVDINPDFFIEGVNYNINSINYSNNPINYNINSVNAGRNTEESTQRKGKKSKVNERKEKGKKKSPLSDGLKSEISEEAIEEKEKSSVKKEKSELTKCRDYFLSNALGYYWEEQDDKALGDIIEKIQHSFGGNLNEEEIEQNFQLFIQHLPKYWRTKKFTLTNLNRNFNEIINEIQNQNNGTAKAKFGRHTIDELADRASTFGR